MTKHRSTVRLVVMLAAGTAAAAVTGLLGWWPYAATVGWAIAALVYSTWVWIVISGFDATQTRSHASREEPARGIADALVVALSIASLVAVGFVLVRASSLTGAAEVLLAVLALVSVGLSWFMLHTLFTLRYARLYYASEGGGIDFNQTDAPRYSDFAYLAFTVGMTFQVSDTSLTSHGIRIAVLRHALLSFVFGSVILATTVNLVAGLSR
jgi:uncharacterized membrane protein